MFLFDLFTLYEKTTVKIKENKPFQRVFTKVGGLVHSSHRFFLINSYFLQKLCLVTENVNMSLISI